MEGLVELFISAFGLLIFVAILMKIPAMIVLFTAVTMVSLFLSARE